MTPSLLGRTRARRALLLSTAALGATAVAAPAAPAAVTLEWSTVNAFRLGCSGSGVDCTWLGYLTNPVPGAGPQGTASLIAPATGPAVTPQSPRGGDQNVSWSFPAVSGSLFPAGSRGPDGTLRFDGGLRFVSPSFAQRLGHGFTTTVEDPRIVLDGEGSGALYATGVHTSAGPDSAVVPYDETQPVFNLTGARWSGINWDGSQTVTLTPAIAAKSYAFPAQYDVGDGPDRTPNTFGSFTIRIAPDGGPKGDRGETGARGQDGRNGTNGTNGKNGTTKVVRIQTSTLRRAPFKGKAARKVRVTARRSNTTLATGTVRGRTLTVTLAPDAKKKQLKGVYVLRLVGKTPTATVRLP